MSTEVRRGRQGGRAGWGREKLIALIERSASRRVTSGQERPEHSRKVGSTRGLTPVVPAARKQAVRVGRERQHEGNGL
jgi:hypothetical protein